MSTPLVWQYQQGVEPLQPITPAYNPATFPHKEYPDLAFGRLRRPDLQGGSFAPTPFFDPQFGFPYEQSVDFARRALGLPHLGPSLAFVPIVAAPPPPVVPDGIAADPDASMASVAEWQYQSYAAPVFVPAAAFDAALFPRGQFPDLVWERHRRPDLQAGPFAPVPFFNPRDGFPYIQSLDFARGTPRHPELYQSLAIGLVPPFIVSRGFPYGHFEDFARGRTIHPSEIPSFFWGVFTPAAVPPAPGQRQHGPDIRRRRLLGIRRSI